MRKNQWFCGTCSQQCSVLRKLYTDFRNRNRLCVGVRVCSGGNISPCPGTNLPCVEWTLKGFGCPHPRLLHVRSLLALSSSLPIGIRWDIIKRDPYAGCAKKDPGKVGRASSVRLKTGAGGGLTLFSLLTTSSLPWENGILHAMKICAVLQ